MENPNPHVQWRLDLARQLCTRLRQFEGIQALLVGGSVARGYADEYSDLELPIIWDTLPDDGIRRAIAAELGAEFLYPYNGPAREDNLLVGGLQVDLWHNTVERDEAVIASVLEGYSTDLGASNFMDTIRSGIPLLGEALIARWKTLARQYPEALVVRNIELNLQGFDLKQLDLAVKRMNPVMFYGCMANVQLSLFHVLLALNKEYFPTLKWIFPSLQEMASVPTHIAPRLLAIYQLPLEDGLKTVRDILLETLDLVATQYPHIDLALTRKNVLATRQAHALP